MQTQELTPTMHTRGLGVKERNTARRDGGTREEFRLIIEGPGGREYAANMTPEPGGGWSCFVDGSPRHGYGLIPSSAFSDATQCETNKTPRRPRAWTACIENDDGRCARADGNTAVMAINNAYTAFAGGRMRKD
jgi:hypothetical protein